MWKPVERRNTSDVRSRSREASQGSCGLLRQAGRGTGWDKGAERDADEVQMMRKLLKKRVTIWFASDEKQRHCLNMASMLQNAHFLIRYIA